MIYRSIPAGRLVVIDWLFHQLEYQNHHKPTFAQQDLSRWLAIKINLLQSDRALFGDRKLTERYITTLKAFEFKSPDALRERIADDHFSKLSNCLSQIKSVNKTDVITLASNYSSLYDLIHDESGRLGALPGFGEAKVKRLTDAFDTPFLSSSWLILPACNIKRWVFVVASGDPDIDSDIAWKLITIVIIVAVARYFLSLEARGCGSRRKHAHQPFLVIVS